MPNFFLIFCTSKNGISLCLVHITLDFNNIFGKICLEFEFAIVTGTFKSLFFKKSPNKSIISFQKKKLVIQLFFTFAFAVIFINLKIAPIPCYRHFVFSWEKFSRQGCQITANLYLMTVAEKSSEWGCSSSKDINYSGLLELGWQVWQQPRQIFYRLTRREF